jgi:hypothetical protein
VTRVELESGLLPAPAGSAALSVSWRARSRQGQIRDRHRAQRRGSSRRYKRRLTLLQEAVSWFHSLLCSAPLCALDVVTQQGPGLSEIASIHALLRQSMTHSARRYDGPYLVVAQYCNEDDHWFCPDIRRPVVFVIPGSVLTRMLSRGSPSLRVRNRATQDGSLRVAEGPGLLVTQVRSSGVTLTPATTRMASSTSAAFHHPR